MNVHNHPDISMPPDEVVNMSMTYYQQSQALTIPKGNFTNRRITSVISSHTVLVRDYEGGNREKHTVAGYQALGAVRKEHAKQELAVMSRLHGYDFSASTTVDVFAIIEREKQHREGVVSCRDKCEKGSSDYKHYDKLCTHLAVWIDAQMREYSAAIEELHQARDKGIGTAKYCAIIGMQTASLEANSRLGRGLQRPQNSGPKHLLERVENSVLGGDADVKKAITGLRALNFKNEQQVKQNEFYGAVRDLIQEAHQESTAKFPASQNKIGNYIEEITETLRIARTAVEAEVTGASVGLSDGDQELFADLIFRHFISHFKSPCVDYSKLETKLGNHRALLSAQSYDDCGPMPRFSASLDICERILLPLIDLREKTALLTLDMDVWLENKTGSREELTAQANALLENFAIPDKREVNAIESRWLRSHATDLKLQVAEKRREQEEKLGDLREAVANG